MERNGDVCDRRARARDRLWGGKSSTHLANIIDARAETILVDAAQEENDLGLDNRNERVAVLLVLGLLERRGGGRDAWRRPCRRRQRAQARRGREARRESQIRGRRRVGGRVLHRWEDRITDEIWPSAEGRAAGQREGRSSARRVFRRARSEEAGGAIEDPDLERAVVALRCCAQAEESRAGGLSDELVVRLLRDG